MSRTRQPSRFAEALRRLLPAKFRDRRLDAEARLARLDEQQRRRLAANLQKLVRPKDQPTTSPAN